MMRQLEARALMVSHQSHPLGPEDLLRRPLLWQFVRQSNRPLVGLLILQVAGGWHLAGSSGLLVSSALSERRSFDGSPFRPEGLCICWAPGLSIAVLDLVPLVAGETLFGNLLAFTWLPTTSLFSGFAGPADGCSWLLASRAPGDDDNLRAAVDTG